MRTFASTLLSWRSQAVSDSYAVTLNDLDNAPDSAAVVAGDTLVSEEDYRKRLAIVGNERDALQAELEKVQRRVRTVEILDQLIEPMAKRSFAFMCAYCGVVGAFVAAHGFGLWGFALPESVLQFLVGSTATTVIGLVGMVLTGIFVGARNGKS